MGRSIKRKILVVSIDSDDMGGRQEDVPPSTESVDDCEEFSVVDIVILLCLIEGARYTPNGSESPSVIFLGEDGSCCKLRRIHFQKEGSFVVGLL
jgi:hypothetical protein